MKSFRYFCAFVATFTVLFAASPQVSADADPGQITSSIGRVLEQFHYSRHKLDKDISQRTLLRYLETLDYGHLVFTQQDVDAFVAKYGDVLDDDTAVQHAARLAVEFNRNHRGLGGKCQIIVTDEDGEEVAEYEATWETWH